MKAEIENAIKVLASEGTIIYPTDTIWGLGCDATNEKAVAKVFDLKQRSGSKSLIILVDSISMLQQYIPNIPDIIPSFLYGTKRPTTVIYKHPIGLASNVVAADNTVAVRIVQNEFCKALIHEFGGPIVSTSVNFSNQPSPAHFDEIDPLLLKQVDYIVNLPAVESKNTASQIIKVGDHGEIEYIRK
jgi:L-threonylcarbamoyladenylate synthase